MIDMSSWRSIREARIGNDPDRKERIHQERLLLDLEVALAELRKRRGLSQLSLAETLGTSQPNVSRIEREDDIQLSTLAGYIAGLGGELHISVAFTDDGEHIPLTPAAVNRMKGSSDMAKGNDSDRYVVPNSDRGGWDVKKEKAGRASAHTDTKKEAVDRAREIVRNEGGGEIRIANRDGKLSDSDTVSGPRHKESRAKDRK